jgi:hypothetical protein
MLPGSAYGAIYPDGTERTAAPRPARFDTTGTDTCALNASRPELT